MRRLILLATLALGLGAAEEAGAPDAARDVHLHTLGTGIIGYNSLPYQISEWLAYSDAVEAAAVEISYVWPFPNLMLPDTGMNLPQDETREGLFSRIASNAATHTVVELRPVFYTERYGRWKGAGDLPDPPPMQERVDGAIDHIAALVAEADRELVLFVHQAFERHEDGSIGAKHLEELPLVLAAARRTGATVVPCHLAEALVVERHPELPIHRQPSDGHPEGLQVYLYLCTFYAALTGEDPRTADLPLHCRHRPVVVVVDDEGRERKRRGESEDLPLEPATAAKLQACAWDAWQQIQAELAAAEAAEGKQDD